MCVGVCCVYMYVLTWHFNELTSSSTSQTDRQTDSFLDKLGATCIFAKLVDFYYNKENNNNKANNSAYLLFVVRFEAK